VKFGKKVLIENVGESLEKCLYPFFNKEMLLNQGGLLSINLQRANVPIDANFRLYITTEVANPQFPAEVSVFGNFINFGITKNGLEAQLLSIIVKDKLAAVEKEFVEIKKKAFDNFVRLDKIENMILAALESDIMTVLNDESLIENLTQSSYTSKKITQTLYLINQAQTNVNKSRAKYYYSAKRATLLYFIVKDLPRIEHTYQFSLRWFLRQFSEVLSARDNINPNVDPLVDLNNRLVTIVYNRVCMGMKQKDKVMVAFLLTINMMESEFKVPEKQLQFIIKGPGEQTEIPFEQMTQMEKDEVEEKEKMSLDHPLYGKLMT
jgi:dynein heavy chain